MFWIESIIAVVGRGGRPRTKRSEGGRPPQPRRRSFPTVGREELRREQALLGWERLSRFRAAGPDVRGCREPSRNGPRPSGADKIKLKEQAASVAKSKIGHGAFSSEKPAQTLLSSRSGRQKKQKRPRVQNRSRFLPFNIYLLTISSTTPSHHTFWRNPRGCNSTSPCATLRRPSPVPG